MRMWFLVVAAILTSIPTGCGMERPPDFEVPGGDAAAGRLVIEQYGCGACHTIPGVRGARGKVGPPLDTFARHPYIAGKFPNRPQLLIRFIQNPPALAPRTAMPALGISDAHARDIAAYLYELR